MIQGPVPPHVSFKLPSQVGTILAQSCITLEAGSHLHGAALSLNDAVSITYADVTLERDGIDNGAYNASPTTSQTPQASAFLAVTPSSTATQVWDELLLAAANITANIALALCADKRQRLSRRGDV